MSNKEVLRFHAYALPTIQITKYIDSESTEGGAMYDLYLNGQREQRYDINGLLYRLELMFRVAGGPNQKGVIKYDDFSGRLLQDEASAGDPEEGE